MDNKQFPPNVEDRASWLAVKHVDEYGENLSEWEIEFIESVTKQLLVGRFLTDKQIDIVETIRQKRVNN